mgnify:CR=1 FL=1
MEYIKVMSEKKDEELIKIVKGEKESYHANAT